MPDRKTKALLLAIALGLWANVATQWFRPTPLHAQGTFDAQVAADISRLRRSVSSLEVDVSGLASGVCVNPKLC